MVDWRVTRETARALVPSRDLAGASLGQIVAYCVDYSHADICNGGFHQYFQNHTGDYAMATIRALRAIGEDERAAVMTRAMARFPDGVAPLQRAKRVALLKAIDFQADWRPWIEPIERAYYALDEKALEQRSRAYIDAHPENFFLPSSPTT